MQAGDRPRRACAELQPLPEVVALVDKAIAAEPAATIHDGQIIRARLPRRSWTSCAPSAATPRRSWRPWRRRRRPRTGIPSLKIKYNKVFGYFIEVTNAHLQLVPADYIRKQTLVNAERFLTAGAEGARGEDPRRRGEDRRHREGALPRAPGRRSSASRPQLNRNADCVAVLDVLAAAGRARPAPRLRAPGGQRRHGHPHPGRPPPGGRSAVRPRLHPQRPELAADSEQVLIITGPNMGGKSTYLRQTALIVILAQMGLLRPRRPGADRASCDRIFTRIGASDSLLEGKSTFLVEMIETANILNNATAQLADPARRDRPRHLHLRRPLHRLGRGRVPARPEGRSRAPCSPPTTTS